MKNNKINVIFFSKFFLISLFIFLIVLGIALGIMNLLDGVFKKNNGNDILRNEEYYDKDESDRKDLIIKGYMDKKLIALTFDDGPSKYTQDLLKILEDKNVVATFFVLGQNAEKYPNLLKEINKRNEIGVHSYVHKLFTKLKNEAIIEQIDKTENVIKENIEYNPTIIRVPYGSLNNRVKDLLLNNGYSSILWTIDSKDWSFRNTDKVYNYVIKRIKGNDIILMHDIYKTSINAASKLIDTLTEEGYIFVTISELLEVQNLNII